MALKKIFDAFQNSTDAQVASPRFASVMCCANIEGVLCFSTRKSAWCTCQGYLERLQPGSFGNMSDIANSQHHCLGLWSVQRTFREIMFLQELTTHDNIIKCALLTPLILLPLTAASRLIQRKQLLAVSLISCIVLDRVALPVYTRSALQVLRAGIAFLQSLHRALCAHLAFMEDFPETEWVCACVQAGECVQGRE